MHLWDVVTFSSLSLPTGLACVLFEILLFFSSTPLLRWHLGGGWEGGLLVLQAQELMEMVGVVPCSQCVF